MAEVRFGCGEYTVSANVGELPSIYRAEVQRATLHDDFGIKGSEGTLLVVTVIRSTADWPDLVISQRFSPGPQAGFHPGIFLISETQILLVGAGTHLLAYDLRT